ncbi:MAG: shikimate dehydrogenase [Nitrospiraceae bacterium]|jgi:shikimate dehydrogenase|nr:MAG: shikimate dehydrogenase [Nitrospiraceae bacterium]
MNVTGRTKLTGLYGYPVEHTLSPLMHNAAFEHLGIDYCYLPFSVHPDSLKTAIEAIRALNLAGVNVTIPHKESVIPYLDVVSEEALFIGAVNTVTHQGGTLTGHNTDGRGFMRSLSENNISPDNKKVLIVGAGGASRAIGYYLSEKAGALYLYDIDRMKLEKLASDLSAIRGNIHILNNIVAGDFDVLINATPLGLKATDPLPFDVSSLSHRQTVCDLIYKKTPLLSQAEQKGCRTNDGLGMLLWQGVFAFELWTGISPPVDIMRNALLRGMK